MLLQKKACEGPEYHESTEFYYLFPIYYSAKGYVYGNNRYHYLTSRNGHLEFAITECNCMKMSVENKLCMNYF